MADIKREEEVRTTDMAPISKKVIKQIPVKIEVIEGGSHARITAKDGSLLPVVVPFHSISKRFNKGEKVAFFTAQVASTVGALEIAERLPKAKHW